MTVKIPKPTIVPSIEVIMNQAKSISSKYIDRLALD